MFWCWHFFLSVLFCSIYCRYVPFFSPPPYDTSFRAPYVIFFLPKFPVDLSSDFIYSSWYDYYRPCVELAFMNIWLFVATLMVSFLLLFHISCWFSVIPIYLLFSFLFPFFFISYVNVTTSCVKCWSRHELIITILFDDWILFHLIQHIHTPADKSTDAQGLSV